MLTKEKNANSSRRLTEKKDRIKLLHVLKSLEYTENSIALETSLICINFI